MDDLKKKKLVNDKYKKDKHLKQNIKRRPENNNLSDRIQRIQRIPLDLSQLIKLYQDHNHK